MAGGLLAVRCTAAMTTDSRDAVRGVYPGRVHPRPSRQPCTYSILGIGLVSAICLDSASLTDSARLSRLGEVWQNTLPTAT